jgi:outer membrane protein TolC
LALASERRIAAEQNVAAAEEFERTTALQVSGGEAAPVDQIRARLQTTTRRDELEQARANEAVAADSLRVLIGYNFTQAISTTELLQDVPVEGEIERLTADTLARRPEFQQLAAERRAAQEEIKAARAERRPQVTYSVSGGFVSDSLRPPNIKEHTGISATVGISIPIFDGGVTRSRVRQAELRAQANESARILAERTLAQAFFSARAQAISAAARIRLANLGIHDAEQNLNASLARYRVGEAQIIEVTEAQNTLIAQRAALYQAIFDYQVARARLRQATGQ